jgi:methylated-DNA-[protein]-cysteine S-methyltransferase
VAVGIEPFLAVVLRQILEEGIEVRGEPGHVRLFWEAEVAMKARSLRRPPELFGPQFVSSVESPIGRTWVESDDRAILRVSFEALGRGRSVEPKILGAAITQLKEYFRRKRRSFELPLPERGSVFRKRVWRELERIPFGRVKSYQELTDATGGSARAVGGACSVNPLPIIVPCHRVLASNGLLTGYIGGMWRKRWLLEHEGVLPRELFRSVR